MGRWSKQYLGVTAGARLRKGTRLAEISPAPLVSRRQMPPTPLARAPFSTPLAYSRAGCYHMLPDRPPSTPATMCYVKCDVAGPQLNATLLHHQDMTARAKPSAFSTMTWLMAPEFNHVSRGARPLIAVAASEPVQPPLHSGWSALLPMK